MKCSTTRESRAPLGLNAFSVNEHASSIQRCTLFLLAQARQESFISHKQGSIADFYVTDLFLQYTRYPPPAASTNTAVNRMCATECVHPIATARVRAGRGRVRDQSGSGVLFSSGCCRSASRDSATVRTAWPDRSCRRLVSSLSCKGSTIP